MKKIKTYYEVSDGYVDGYSCDVLGRFETLEEAKACFNRAWSNDPKWEAHLDYVEEYEGENFCGTTLNIKDYKGNIR